MTKQRRFAGSGLRVLFSLILLSYLAMGGQGYREDVVKPDALRFRLDASQSKFIAHALRGGLLWFKGHEHHIAARDFTGEAMLTPNSIVPASLQLSVDAGSMVETSDAFTAQQKEIINKELREIVLEPAKYPQIVFKSTDVSAKLISPNQYEVKIVGDLTLHGVTRHITIPARITLSGNELRAVGEFSINRSDFNVKATSALQRHDSLARQGNIQIRYRRAADVRLIVSMNCLSRKS